MSAETTEVVAHGVLTSDSAKSSRRMPLLTANDSSGLVTAFLWEFNPIGVAEETLVRELARRAMHLERMDQALAGLERTASSAFSQVAFDSATDEDSMQQVRALVAGAERTEAIVRRSLGASRAFCRALAMSRELFAERRAAVQSGPNPIHVL